MTHQLFPGELTRIISLGLACSLLAAPGQAADQTWPQFRGPTGLGAAVTPDRLNVSLVVVPREDRPVMIAVAPARSAPISF